MPIHKRADRSCVRFPARTLVRFLSVSAFLTLAAGRASAGPPYITDDPEPVEYRHWEIYIASEYANYKDAFGVVGTAPHIEVNYGVAPNVQLHVIAPMAYGQFPGGALNYGIGDIELGVKYRFVQETKSQPMVGTFPLIEVPTGDSSRNLGNGQTQFFLPLWLQKSWGALTTYGGGGYWHNPGVGQRDYWFAGWLVQYNVTRKFAPGIEIFYASSSLEGVSDRTGFNAGFTYDFDEGHHLLFSAGTDFHGPTGSIAYLAYQWTFGPHEHDDKQGGTQKPQARTHSDGMPALLRVSTAPLPQ